MQLELLIEESLGMGRFVVTNNSRADIPAGTVFTALFTQAMELVEENFQESEVSPSTEIRLRIVEIDFWRKPHPCVPRGHHAGVRFEGDGVGALEEQIKDRKKPSHVIVATEARHA